MSVQKETRSQAENKTSLQLLGHDTTNATISGGPIENFTEGWALRAFPWSQSGHYFRVANNLGGFIALCGHHTYSNLLGIGNFSKCLRCQKALKHRGKA